MKNASVIGWAFALLTLGLDTAEPVKAALLLGGEGEITAGDSGFHNLIYDSTQDLTWLDHRNNPPELMADTIAWAASLVVRFDETDYTEWRLPTTDENVNPTHSEMGQLYDDLGGNVTSGPFDSLLAQQYWSGTLWFNGIANSGWGFHFGTGFEINRDFNTTFLWGMAVHPGNITGALPPPPPPPNIPLPPTLWLFIPAVLGLLAKGRARKTAAVVCNCTPDVIH